jgi:hypothetical protein
MDYDKNLIMVFNATFNNISVLLEESGMKRPSGKCKNRVSCNNCIKLYHSLGFGLSKQKNTPLPPI